MSQQQAAGLALPAEALAPLAAGVKAWRQALLVLEPWLDAQPPSLAAHAMRRQIRAWQGVVTSVEQQVVAHVEAT